MNMPMIPMLFRARAREVLKKNLSTALMVSFLVSLPGLLVQVYQQFSCHEITELLRFHMLALTDLLDQGAAAEALLAQLRLAGGELLNATTPAVEASVWLSLAVNILTPVLTLGMIAYLLKLVRGQEGELKDMLSRLSSFPKVIAKAIVIGVKLLLWSLPGTVLSFAALYGFILSNGTSDLLLYVYAAGFIVTIWLLIRASLHYSMSNLILADDPSVGVLACVKQSVELMRKHKMDFVRVYLAFILMNLLAGWAGELMGALSPVLGTVTSLACQLVLSLYINTTIVIFYMALKGEGNVMPQSMEVRMVHWPDKNGDDQSGNAHTAPNDGRDDNDDNDDNMLN